MEAFDLRSEIHLPDISEQQFNNAINELEGKTSLEAQATVESRIEEFPQKEPLWEESGREVRYM